MDCEVPVLCWSVVSSVNKEKLSEESLRCYFEWLTVSLSERAQALGITLHFDKSATIVHFVEEDRRESVENAYCTIHRKWAQVIVVFHVLSKPDCDEYEWMREFSLKYGIARQGILYANVVSRFKNADSHLDDILENISRWLEERIGQLAHGNSNVRALGLRIERAVEPLNDSHPLSTESQHLEQNVEASVMTSLHGARRIFGSPYMNRSGFGYSRNVNVERSAQIEISGLPENFQLNDLEQLFKGFDIRQEIEHDHNSRSAIVTLANKFEAYQVCKKYKRRLDQSTITIQPRCEELKNRLSD